MTTSPDPAIIKRAAVELTFGEREMAEGFMDGYNPDAPEPSDNRSASYRHGFRSAQADHGKPRTESFAATRAAADRAITEDNALHRTTEQKGPRP